MDPTQLVRDTTAWVVAGAKHVTIDDDAIEEIATNLASEFKNDRSVAWDEEGWHYRDLSSDAGTRRTVQYLFVLDALNFCFWPSPGLEYIHLATGLRDVLLRDPSAFGADRLKVVTAEDIASWIPGATVPHLEERAAHLRMVGDVLGSEWDGEAMNMVLAAERSAVELVRLILAAFPGFRDHVVYKARLVHFYKRAQILVGDLWGAFGMQRSGDSPCAFSDITSLTMFADYRVPQTLLLMKILRYSDELQAVVDAKQEIPYASQYEVEIRASTVQAVERLRAAGLRHGMSDTVSSVQLDWRLWQLMEQSVLEEAEVARRLKEANTGAAAAKDTRAADDAIGAGGAPDSGAGAGAGGAGAGAGPTTGDEGTAEAADEADASAASAMPQFHRTLTVFY